MTMIKRKLRARWAVLAGVAVLSPACTMLLGADKDYYYEDEGAGGSGQGGSGGQGAAAGGHGGGGQGGEGGGLPPPPCTEATDCPTESACRVPVCENNTCGTVPARDDTPCDGGQSVCQGGMCVCAPGLKDCNGNCVNTNSDSEHCGACGHSCQGGPCEASACRPFPVATGQAHPLAITVNGTHVYWTDHDAGTVMRVPLQGGVMPQELSANHVHPLGIRVSASHVYWTESGDTSVWKANLDGTGDVEIANSEIAPMALAIDDTSVYWINEDNSSIRSAALDDGTLTTLAQMQQGPRGLAVYQDFLYWTSRNGGFIRRLDLVTMTDTMVVTGLTQPTDIVADANGIYWIDGYRIWRADHDGWGMDELAAGQVGAKRLAVDDQHVYWTEFSLGDIRRALKDGSGSVEVFVSGQEFPLDISSPWAIAVDATSVYWTDVETDAIMKRAK